MKKIFLLLLSFCMLYMVIGCGEVDKTSETTETSGTPETTNPPNTSKAPEKTIGVWETDGYLIIITGDEIRIISKSNPQNVTTYEIVSSNDEKIIVKNPNNPQVTIEIEYTLTNGTLTLVIAGNPPYISKPSTTSTTITTIGNGTTTSISSTTTTDNETTTTMNIGNGTTTTTGNTTTTNNTTTSSSTPPLIGDVRFIEVNGSIGSAIDKDGNLWAWGDNYYGNLDDETTDKFIKTPFKYKPAMKFTSASLGQINSLAIDKDGNLWGWGGAQINVTDIKTPVQIKSDTKFTKVAITNGNNFAIDNVGNLWAWGRGRYIDGTDELIKIPVQIKSDTKFTKVATGNTCSFAIDSTGNLWAWGNNQFGQLGDDTTTDRYSPVQIKKGTKFTEVASAPDAYPIGLAIDNAGNLWGWGIGIDGTAARIKTPIQIASGTKFTKISCCMSYNLAIDNAGNLWAWGNGRPINGTVGFIYPPIQINSDIKFTEISTGGGGSCLGIDVNGNLWGWSWGRTEDGTEITNELNSPVPISLF